MSTELTTTTEKFIDNRPSALDFALIQRKAAAYAASTLVPKEYQNNVPNCIIAVDLAQRMGANELMVMQNLVIVHGRPTWSAQYLISTVNTCGRFSAIRYEFFGEKGADDWGCRGWAIEKATGEKLVGTDITIGIAKKEGWYGKSGSKWQSIPQQMLMYRAGSWWTRVYAPELSMGLHTAEEAYDIGEMKDVTPSNPPAFVDKINQEILNASAIIPPEVNQNAIDALNAKITGNEAFNTETGEVIEAQATAVDSSPVEAQEASTPSPTLEEILAMPATTATTRTAQVKAAMKWIAAGGDKLEIIQALGGEEYLAQLGRDGQGMGSKLGAA